MATLIFCIFADVQHLWDVKPCLAKLSGRPLRDMAFRKAVLEPNGRNVTWALCSGFRKPLVLRNLAPNSKPLLRHVSYKNRPVPQKKQSLGTGDHYCWSKYWLIGAPASLFQMHCSSAFSSGHIYLLVAHFGRSIIALTPQQINSMSDSDLSFEAVLLQKNNHLKKTKKLFSL